MGLPGNLLMDTPPHITKGELTAKTKDRIYWGNLTASIYRDRTIWVGHTNRNKFSRLVKSN